MLDTHDSAFAPEPEILSPGEQLHRRVRLRLAGRGITLTQAAAQIGGQRGRDLKRENLSRALLGKWRGPDALAVVQAALNLADLTDLKEEHH